jgi:hypothetical protein
LKVKFTALCHSPALLQYSGGLLNTGIRTMEFRMQLTLAVKLPGFTFPGLLPVKYIFGISQLLVHITL